MSYAFKGIEYRISHIYVYIIERANAQSAADPIYLDGMVWSASYALARPRAQATGAMHRAWASPTTKPKRGGLVTAKQRHGGPKRPKLGAENGRAWQGRGPGHI